MSQVTILHNPRCSKSRQTLALLQEQGIEPQIREYLKNPLNEAELENLLAALGMASARDLMRTKEDDYKAQQLGNVDLTQAELLAAMAATPKLMERPVVINGQKARIGRPPESVLEIL